jgi:hypothetical protein
MANRCGVRADLGIVTTTDGGLFMDGGRHSRKFHQPRELHAVA